MSNFWTKMGFRTQKFNFLGLTFHFELKRFSETSQFLEQTFFALFLTLAFNFKKIQIFTHMGVCWSPNEKLDILKTNKDIIFL